MESIEKNNVVEVYSQIAKHFSDTRVNQWTWITSYIEMITSPNFQYPLVLDVGCGNGRNMEQFRNDYIYGIDNCQEFVDMCKQKGKNVTLGDMTDINFPNHVFDHLLSIASFHHLSTEERRIKALKEMHRIIKPRGTMLLSVWSIEQPPNTKQFKAIKNYGDVMVTWNKYGETFDRYYYIFEIDEITNLFKITGWKILSHTWDYGNEVFILKSI